MLSTLLPLLSMQMQLAHSGQLPHPPLCVWAVQLGLLVGRLLALCSLLLCTPHCQTIYVVSWSAAATNLCLSSSLMTRLIRLSSPSVAPSCRAVSTSPLQSTSDQTFHTILGAKLGNIFALLYVCAFIGLSLTRENCRFSMGERARDGRSTDISRRPVLALILLLACQQGPLGIVPLSSLQPLGNDVPRPLVRALPAPNQATGSPGRPVWCGCPSR